MAITRAKATSLLNKTEMGLFDDSRRNALGGHSDARLNQLVTRARTARDRARDLEKRQRLALRGKTGSKSAGADQANARTGEKAALLADILGRFEDRQSQSASTGTRSVRTAKTTRTPSVAAKKASKSARPSSKVAGGKTAGSTAATRKTTAVKKTAARSASRKTASAAGSAGKSASRTTAAAKAAAGKSASAKSAPGRAGPAASAGTSRKSKSTGSTTSTRRKALDGAASHASGSTATRVARPRRATVSTGASRRASAGKSAGITAEQALRNTQALLETRQAEARSDKSWETLGVAGSAEPSPGFQSPQARATALDLHSAEIRQASTQGSISTRGRKTQGKRDNRNRNDG